jgi:hypothetical protein
MGLSCLRVQVLLAALARVLRVLLNLVLAGCLAVQVLRAQELAWVLA